MSNPYEKYKEYKQRGTERVHDVERELRMKRFEANNEALRDDAESSTTLRDDEFPTRWGLGMLQPTLQLPFPQIAAAPTLIPPGITNVLDPDFQRRNVYWQAYAEKTAEAAKSGTATASALHTFHDAAHDPDLGALNYSIGANEIIDIGAATEREIVPNQGARKSVGSLFDANDKVPRDPGYDIEGFSSVKNSVANGRSGVKTADEGTQRADEALRSEMLEMRARIDGLRSAALTLQSIAAQLAAFTTHQAGDAAQGEIDAYKEDAANAAETVETITDVIAGLVHAFSEEGGQGDAIEKLGDIAAKAASHMNDEKIAEARKKLDKLRSEEAKLSGIALVRSFGAASLHLNAQLVRVDQQIDNIRSALGARKTSYGGLGESVGKAIPSAPGKDKVAATMAAIPLVEMVVMKAREIRVAAIVPTHDAAAARGVTIARENQHPSAGSFLIGCDQLRAAHAHGVSEEKKWITRRDELFKIKESILGRRPGPKE